MTAATTPAKDRPRPGPIRLLGAAVGGGVILAIAFGLLLAVDQPGAAAALLLLPPLAEMVLRRGRIGVYVGRHTGLEATAYTLTAVWAAGLAAVFTAHQSPGPVWIAASAVTMAAAAAAVERIVWARFPTQLEGRRLTAVD